MKVADSNLTPRQQKWFASVQASLERDTGKTLPEWVEIVRRDCPETSPRKQEAWLKATFGMSMVRAGHIIHQLSPEKDPWDDPAGMRAALWTDPASTAILDAVEAAVADFPDLVPTQRKAFTAWSRQVQFAALRPVKGGKAMLGLAVFPNADPRLVPAKKESWSERLKAQVALESPADIDAGLVDVLRAAWERS